MPNDDKEPARKELIEYLLETESNSNLFFNRGIKSYLDHKVSLLHSVGKPEYLINFLFSGIRHAPYSDLPSLQNAQVYHLQPKGEDNKPIFEIKQGSPLAVVEYDHKIVGIKIHTVKSGKDNLAAWTEEEKLAFLKVFQNTEKEMILKQIKIKHLSKKLEVTAADDGFSMSKETTAASLYDVIALKSDAYNLKESLKDFSSHEQTKVKAAAKQFFGDANRLIEADKAAISGHEDSVQFISEAALHGYLDGLLAMDFRQRNRLQIHSELLSGKGYIDLLCLSVKGKNWHAVPIVIELKTSRNENALQAIAQIEKQKYAEVPIRARTLSNQRVLVGFNPNFPTEAGRLSVETTAIVRSDQSALDSLLAPTVDQATAALVVERLLLDTIPSNGGANKKYHSIAYLLLGQTFVSTNNHLKRYVFIGSAKTKHANMAIVFKDNNNHRATVLEISMTDSGGGTRNRVAWQPDYSQFRDASAVKIIRCKVSSDKHVLPEISIDDQFPERKTTDKEGEFRELTEKFTNKELKSFIEKGIFDNTDNLADRQSTLTRFYEKINRQTSQLRRTSDEKQGSLFPDEASVQYALTGAYARIRDNIGELTEAISGQQKHILVYPEYQVSGGKIDLVVQGVTEYNGNNVIDGVDSTPLIHELKYSSNTTPEKRKQQAREQLLQYEPFTKALTYQREVLTLSLSFEQKTGTFSEIQHNEDLISSAYIEHTSSETQDSITEFGSPVRKKIKLGDCLSPSKKRRHLIGGSDCFISLEDEQAIESQQLETFIDPTLFLAHLEGLPREAKHQLIRLVRTKPLVSYGNREDYKKTIALFKAVDDPNQIDELLYPSAHDLEASDALLDKHPGPMRSKLRALNRIGNKINSGFLAKTIITEIEQGHWEEVSMNVMPLMTQPIAGYAGTYLEKKGIRLLTQPGKALLGKLSRTSAVFLKRAPVVFNVYFLAQSIEALKQGEKGAVEGVVVNGAQLAVDGAEIGIKLIEVLGGEAVEVGAGIASEVLGPVGLLILVGDRIYQGVERVEAIEKLIPLTSWEKFEEGLKGFLGFDISAYIQDLMQEKACNNGIATEKLRRVKENSGIHYYFFSSCNDVEKLAIHRQIDLSRQRQVVSRAAPELPEGVRLICFTASNDPRSNVILDWLIYHCDNVIGVELTENQRENQTIAFFDLGFGQETVRGFRDVSNVFHIERGAGKRYQGGNEDDIFIITSGADKQQLDGAGGDQNTVKLHLPPSHSFYAENSDFFELQNMQILEGKTNDSDSVHVKEDQFSEIDVQGGEDVVNIAQASPSSRVEREKLRQLIHKPLLIAVHDRINVHIKHTLMRSVVFKIIPSNGLAKIHDQAFHRLKSITRYLKWPYPLEDLKQISIIENRNVLTHGLTFKDGRYLSVRIVKSPFSKIEYISILQDGTYFFQDKQTKAIHAVYMTERSNLEPSLLQYQMIPERANITIIVKSSKNAMAMMASGGGNVLSNSPNATSYLSGGNGNDIYQVVPVSFDSEVYIANYAKDKKTDLLDLTEIRRQEEARCRMPSDIKLEAHGDNLLVRFNGNCSNLSQVVVLNYFSNESFQHLQIKLDNVPLEIKQDSRHGERLILEPLPITLKKPTTIVSSSDVARHSVIKFPCTHRRIKYLQSYNHLLITNVFRKINETYSVWLLDYYINQLIQKISLQFLNRNVSDITLQRHAAHAPSYFYALFGDYSGSRRVKRQSNEIRFFNPNDCQTVDFPGWVLGACYWRQIKTQKFVLTPDSKSTYRTANYNHHLKMTGSDTVLIYDSLQGKTYTLSLRNKTICQTHDQGKLLCQVPVEYKQKVLTWWQMPDSQFRWNFSTSVPGMDVLTNVTMHGVDQLVLIDQYGHRQLLNLSVLEPVALEALLPRFPALVQNKLLEQQQQKRRDSHAQSMLMSQTTQRVLEYCLSHAILHTRLGDFFKYFGFNPNWQQHDDFHWQARLLITLRQGLLDSSVSLRSSLLVFVLETAVLHQSVQHAYTDFIGPHLCALFNWSYNFCNALIGFRKHSQSCYEQANVRPLITIVRLLCDVLQFGWMWPSFLPVLLEYCLPDVSGKSALLWGIRGAVSLTLVGGLRYWHMAMGLMILPQLPMILEHLGIPMTHAMKKMLDYLSQLFMQYQLLQSIMDKVPEDSERIEVSQQILEKAEQRIGQRRLRTSLFKKTYGLDGAQVVERVVRTQR